MSIARKDDRHNEDLVREISDRFNRAVGPEPSEDAAGDSDKGDRAEQPRFVIAGDNRTQRPERRR